MVPQTALKWIYVVFFDYERGCFPTRVLTDLTPSKTASKRRTQCKISCAKNITATFSIKIGNWLPKNSSTIRQQDEGFMYDLLDMYHKGAWVGETAFKKESEFTGSIEDRYMYYHPKDVIAALSSNLIISITGLYLILSKTPPQCKHRSCKDYFREKSFDFTIINVNLLDANVKISEENRHSTHKEMLHDVFNISTFMAYMGEYCDERFQTSLGFFWLVQAHSCAVHSVPAKSHDHSEMLSWCFIKEV